MNSRHNADNQNGAHEIFYYPYASIDEKGQAPLLKAVSIYFDKIYILDLFIDVRRFLAKRLVLSVAVLLGLASFACAQTRVLLMAEADAYVSEALPDVAPIEEVSHILSAGIGSSGGRILSYLRFDLDLIPTSGVFHRVIVESSELRLLAIDYGVANPDVRFLVNVSYCPDSEWVEQEMTWNTRPCREEAEGEDSVILEHYGQLPRIYKWDVTRSVARAKEEGKTSVTFLIEAHRLLDCSRDPLEGIGCEEENWIGFARFTSKERSQFGVSAVPTLMVTHSSHPTPLLSFLNTMLAVLSAIGVIVGLYGAIRMVSIKRGYSKEG